LRGAMTELLCRGHQVRAYEPEDAWSRQNLVAGYGEQPIREFRETYPRLDSRFYRLDTLDLDEALEGADLVIVHEWSDHELVRRIGEHRAAASGPWSPARATHWPAANHYPPSANHGPYRLLFHDTHHRSVTDP